MRRLLHLHSWAGGLRFPRQPVRHFNVACRQRPQSFSAVPGSLHARAPRDPGQFTLPCPSGYPPPSLWIARAERGVHLQPLIDNSSDRADATFVDSFNLNANKASSNFDERHILNISYVYDLPFFNKSSRLKKTLLGGCNGQASLLLRAGFHQYHQHRLRRQCGSRKRRRTGSRPDLAGNPHAAPCTTSSAPGPLLFNPARLPPRRV